MKKFLFLTLILLLGALLIVPASAFCDDCLQSNAVEPSGHCSYYCDGEKYVECASCNDSYVLEYCTSTHIYSCSSNGNGTHTGTCNCGDSYSTSCSYSVISTQPSTCTVAGYNTLKCDFCGHVTTESLPLTDHSWPEEPTSTVMATCTTAGYDYYKCVSCDEFYTDDDPALGHNFGYVSTTPSSCHTKGFETHQCSRCGAYQYKELPLIDHPWPMEYTEKVSATCTTPGITRWKCTACDEWWETDHVAALGHDWETGSLDATCISAGYDMKICKRCGTDLSVTYPALGHKWSKEPIACTSTCYFAGKATYICTVCGETEDRNASKLSHNYVNDICTMCGKTKEASETIIPGGTGGGTSGGAGSSGSTSGGSLGGLLGGDPNKDDLLSDLDTRPMILSASVLGVLALIFIPSFMGSRKRRRKRRK